MTTTTRLIAGILGADGLVSPNVLGPNTFSNTLIDFLKDVDTADISPTINNTLLWDGTNWVPGSVVVSSAENSNIANIVLGQVNASIRSGFANVAAFANVANLANMVVTLSNFTTANLRESSSNLYYTNARVDARFLTTSVNNLVDVDTTGVTSGQVLVWNGSAWVPNTFVSPSAFFSNTTNFANLSAFANLAAVANVSNFANVANLANMVATISNFTTANLRESSSNLYFTNARVDARLATSSIDVLQDVNTGGVSSGDYLRWNGVFWYPSPVVVSAQSADSANVANIANLVASIRNFSTSNLVEGANLYFTNARVDARIATTSIDALTDVNTGGATSGQALIWNGTNWVPQTIDALTANSAQFANSSIIANIANTAAFANVANLANMVATISNFTTTNLREGTNLYYTNSRVFSNVSQMSINVLADVNIVNLDVNDILAWDGSNWVPSSAAALANISVNTDFSNRSNLANMVATISNFDTDYLREGTNLYYTNARVISAITSANLPNLTVGRITLGARGISFTDPNLSPDDFANISIRWPEGGEKLRLTFEVGNDPAGSFGPDTIEFKTPNNSDVLINDNIVWHYGNMGSGSNLDADYLDGYDSSDFIKRTDSTTDLPEGDNKYFTNARVDARIATTSIDSLSDVSIVSLDTNDILAWDGTNWVPTSAAALSNISVNAEFSSRSNFANIAAVANVTNFANVANLANMVATINNFTTDNLREGAANLYYTNVRSRRSISAGDQTIIYDEGLGTIRANLEYFANANITISAVSFVDNKKFTFISTSGQTEFSGIDNEGETLTISRPSKVNVFLNGILMSNVVDYTATQSGIFFNYGVGPNNIVTVIDGVLVGYGVDAANVVNVNGYTGIVNLSTTDIPEGTKLYYTNSRVFSNISLMSVNVLADVNTTGAGVGQALIWDGSNWAPGSVSATGTENANVANTVLSLAGLSTTNLAEGSNLYFTNARSILGSIPAVTQLTVTASGTSGFLFDQYTGEDPTIYVTAGETVAFELNQGSSHPFAIRVSNGGSNYNTGLVHIASDGTTTTGSFAQAKTNGKLFWKVPYDLTGSTYVYQCTVHSGMVGNIVIGMPTGSISSTVNSLTTSNISEGSNLYYTNARVDARIATTSINALFDVDISGISTNQVLSWNGSVFVPASVSTSASATLANSALFANVANLANMVVSISNFTTSDLVEGTGLYYTNSRVYSNIVNALNTYTGNITAGNVTITGKFFGDGSSLTGIVSSGSSNANTSLFANVANLANMVATISNFTTTNLAEGSNLYYTNSRVYSNVTNALGTFTGNITAGNVTITGKFFGDGSALTGISAGSLSGIATYGGNVLATNVTSTSFVVTPKVYLGNSINDVNIGTLNSSGTTNTVINSGSFKSIFSQDGNVTLPNIVVQGKIYGDGSQLTGISIDPSAFATYGGNVLATNVTVTGFILAPNVHLGTSTSNTRLGASGTNNTVIRAGVYTSSFLDDGNVLLPNLVLGGKIYGDGSQLTGVLTSTGAFATYGGNLLADNITARTVVTDRLNSTTGANISVVQGGTNVVLVAGFYRSTFTDDGNVVVPNLVVQGRLTGDASGLTNISSASLNLPTYNGNLLVNNLTASVVFTESLRTQGGANISAISGSTNVILFAGSYQSKFLDTGNVELPNLIVAGKIFGDGSGITNIPVSASLGGLPSYNGNILAANITSQTIRTSNLTVGNVISLNGCVIVKLATDSNTYIQTGSFVSTFLDNGNVLLPNVVASGKFFGDGSALTGITISPSVLATYSGNILADNVTATEFVLTPNLYLGSSLANSRIATSGGANTVITAGSYQTSFRNDGNVILPNLVVQGKIFGDGSKITGVTIDPSAFAVYGGNVLAVNVTATSFILAPNVHLGTSTANTRIGASGTNNTIIRAGGYTSSFLDTGNVLLPNIILGGKIYGDGSQLTGVATVAGLAVYGGNLLADNVTANTVFTNSLRTASGANISAVSGGNNVTIVAGLFRSTFTDDGNIVVPNLVVQGRLTGDAAGLSNISSASLNLPTYGGNLLVNNVTANIVVVNNRLTTPSGGNIAVIPNSTNVIILAGSYSSSFLDNGNVIMPNVVVQGKIYGDGSQISNVAISSGSIAAILPTYNGNLLVSNLTLSGSLNGGGSSNLTSRSDANTVILSGSYSFTFRDTGRLVSNTSLSTSGMYIGADSSTNTLIDDASNGAGSTTLYIGNQSITTSSDIRLKTNVSNTIITALNVVNNLRVVDFNWNDPTDTSFNNKNARGTWTGLIAQEVINQVPYVVNAVRDEVSLEPIPNSTDSLGNDIYWHLEYDKLVPILIKAIQELKKEFDDYKASHP